MFDYKREITYRMPMVVSHYISFASGDYPLCPRCKISIEREYVHFCDCCGQKLNWKKYPHIRRIAPNR